MSKKSFKQKSLALKILTVILWALLAFAALIVLIVIFAPKEAPTETNENTQSTSAVSEVKTVLDSMDKDFKDTLASTSQGGYQGEIVNVKADGKDGVIVEVSTHFKESGMDNDGGKNIAWKIFSNVCMDSPSLKSLYVISTSSKLESRSVYRSDIPACANS